MKILLATYWPIPHVGGVWPLMVQLKERLEAKGHIVDIMGNGNDETNSFIYMHNQNRALSKDKLLPLLKAKLNVSEYPVLHSNPLVNYAEFQRYMFELAAAYFDISSYDVIHTQDVFSTIAMSRIRQPKTALVATLHGCVAHEIRRIKHPTDFIAHAYYNFIEHKGATSAEYTHVSNQWMYDLLTKEFGVPEEQLKVFPYGFDIDNFMKKSQVENDLIPPPNKKVIIYTGRLVKIKGLNHLLSALYDLKYRRDDWVCWIVGDGEKREELLRQHTQLGLDRHVLFLGKRDDVPSLLKKADIYVLPSLQDNQPVAVIEAQLAGKACIVSDVGGLPEMVQHNITGLLTPAGNETVLANHLDLLLGNDIHRNYLGARAKEWALNHWPLERMIDQTLDVYQLAINKRRKSEEK